MNGETMLSTEDMSRIVQDVQTGRSPPRVRGPEADAFRAKVEPEIRAIEEAGLVVDLPTEWPDASE